MPQQGEGVLFFLFCFYFGPTQNIKKKGRKGQKRLTPPWLTFTDTLIFQGKIIKLNYLPLFCFEFNNLCNVL